MRNPFGHRINRLAVAVTAAVGTACVLGALLFWRHHYDDLTAAAKDTALRQADLIRLALAHQMQENERDLIAEMVSSFARDPTIQAVRIVDLEGRTTFASGDAKRGGAAAEAGRALPVLDRPSSQFLKLPEGDVLRVILPIENAPPCHECHEPELPVNGALEVDVRAAAILDSVERDLWWLVIVIGGIALGLLLAISLALRLLVLKRLEHFESVARSIAAGDLERRLPVSGSDTLSWMARAFNAMADSVMRLAEQLRRQRELLEMVINAVDDGIAVLDHEYRFVAANEAFISRTGKDRLNVPGAHCREFIGGTCPSDGCPAEACFNNGERQRALVTRVAPDGVARLEELHASPIRSAGSVVAVVEVWRDITERRAAEARMADAHRMASLGMLASGFSHELNTPLATTLTCVESILRMLNEPGALPERAEEIRERASIAREQILRCRGITQQFLRLSRGQAPTTDMVDLGRLAAAVVRLVEPTATEHGVTVRWVDSADGTALVRASDAELQQVLLNLLLNGIQACKRGGTIEVRVEAGPPARLLVTDDGCGIPQDQLHKIFEPFYGLRKGGTGLGLFLSLAMARGWGAEIAVRSTPGQGSTFEVHFGRAVARAAEA